MNKKYWLFILFLCSIFLRTPNLNRPISKHHEFNTAFFLIPMEIWEEEGIQAHGFSPPYNYTNVADKNISEPIGIKEGNFNGTYYYLSFPAFSYVLPYFTFKVLNIKPSALSLQIFNLVLHFIMCLMLLSLLSLFFSKNKAFLGTLLYIFSPAPLWFHGNGYTHHVLAVVLFVAIILFLFKYLKDFQKGKLIAFSVCFLLLILTEWISVFLGLTIFLVVVFSKQINFNHKRNILTALMISTILGLSLLLFQYNTHIGLEQYLEYQINRFTQRSTLTNTSISIHEQLFAWVKWSVTSFGGFLLAILILVVFCFKKIKNNSESKELRSLLFIVLIPICLHHLIFMEFVYVHDYSVLIDGIVWTIIFTHLLSKIELKPKLLYGVVLSAILISSGMYLAINRPGKYGQNGEPYRIYQNIGKKIKKSIQADETVFLTGFSETVNENNPQIVYYAKRNFKPVGSIDEAKEFLKNNDRKKGKLFYLENGIVVKEKKIIIE